MDPNAALTALRALLAEYQRRDAAGETSYDMAEHLDSIAQQTAALVEWIDRGGFLPADWQRPRPIDAA